MSRLHVTLALTACAALALPSPARAQPTNRTEATAVLFRPDGKTVISAGLDGRLRVWDVATGKEQNSVVADKDGVYGVALSPDGKTVATAGADHHVRLWDADTLKPLRSLEGHTQEVIAVAFSPDGKTLASGGADKTIRIWDLAAGKQVRHFHGHELRVTGLAFSPDGKRLASGGMATAAIPGFFMGVTHADQIRLWDPATGQEVRKLEIRGSVVAFAPDGHTVAGGGMFLTGMPAGRGVAIQGGARVAVSDLAGKELLLVKGQGGAAAFSPDGKFLATAWGSRQHLGRFQFENDTRRRGSGLWELAAGKEVLQFSDAATVIAISPDARKAATGGLNGAVSFLDLKPSSWAAGKRPAEPTPEEFDRLWTTLAGQDAVAAYEALWLLNGDGAAALLGSRLEAVRPAGPRVRQLLANLDGKRFAVREAAYRELKKLGATVEPELRLALKGRLSAEVRKRVAALLQQCGRHPAGPEELRQARALVALERIGGRQARAVLTRLAEGAPGAWLTEEARGALQRLGKR